MATVLFNADDLGLSVEVNQAIAQACRQGVLRNASLMVNEAACADAVHGLQDLPELDVGIHVALSNARAGLSHADAPGLVGQNGRFREHPALSGFALAFRSAVRRDLGRELDLQFRRFAETGIPPYHVDGHQHLHVHPAVFPEVCRRAAKAGFRWIRVPHEEWRPFSVGGLANRRVEWAFFQALRRRCARIAGAHGLRTADRVYGHLETGKMTEAYLVDLLPRLQGAVCEVYAHPGSPLRRNGQEDDELMALTSSQVLKACEVLGLRIGSFRELA